MSIWKRSGTFPAIRLKSVEREGVSAQKHYYRNMGAMTEVKSHDNLDLVTGDVVGFDPTQLDLEIYKTARGVISSDCRLPVHQEALG